MPAAIGTKYGPYVIEAPLGSGGMGEVYRARDMRLGRTVAIKILPAHLCETREAKERFDREARAISSVSHPNICALFDVGEQDGVSYLVMEYLEGETLADRLSQGPLMPEPLVKLTLEVVEGLDKAHRGGMVHRDLKPANLFITQDEHIKILDFGLAKSLEALGAGSTEDGATAAGGAAFTSPGLTVGTIAYMSPEQARGDAVDARSDLFSLGLVMYEMATGRKAFGGSSTAVVFEAILNRNPQPVTELSTRLPAAFENILSKLLEKDADLRYQTAAELRSDLKRLSRDIGSGRRAAATPSGSGSTAQAVPLKQKSVAVLYFENQSGSKEDEYFRDGITEDIVTEISKIGQLDIFPRSEMLAFRDKPVTAQQVSQQLGAAYVLEGSIRRAGNRVRITAQLVEASTRHSVWAERYDRQLEDVFAIQEEIARSIAHALRITLTPQEEKIISAKPTEDPQAYDFYLRGRSYSRRENIDYALQMFEQAIHLDPNFALAHAGIGHLCGLIYELREQNGKWIERGLAACDRATALAPDSPEVLVARARICYAQKKYEESALLAQRAIERKDDCEGGWNILGRAYFAAGKHEEAAALAQHAIEASGDDYNTYMPYVNALDRLGRKKEVDQYKGRLTGVLRQQLERVPEDVRARILLSSVLADMGQEEESTRHLQTAVALRPFDGNTLYNAACTYGVLKRKTEALDVLQRAIKAGYGNIDWMAKDPDLDCLHDEPEFRKLLGKE
jgi:serine/threonine protein kinase/Flp pilus assembly protein TadD